MSARWLARTGFAAATSVRGCCRSCATAATRRIGASACGRRRTSTRRVHGEDTVHAVARATSRSIATRSRRVQAAVERLAPEFREVIVLREFEGLSYKEIAEVVAAPVGTVMSRLSRARAQLAGGARRGWRTTMTCEDVERLADAYADGELDLERTLALEAHVSHCEACAARLARIREVRQTLRTAPYFRAPEALAARVRTTVGRRLRRLRSRPRVLTRQRRWRPWLLSAAASLAVVSLAVCRRTAARTRGPGR